MITLRHTTFGRTPLDEWSVRLRDVYLTTHNTHKRQTSMPPSGIETTIPGSERPQNPALDLAATGTGTRSARIWKWKNISSFRIYRHFVFTHQTVCQNWNSGIPFDSFFSTSKKQRYVWTWGTKHLLWTWIRKFTCAFRLPFKVISKSSYRNENLNSWEVERHQPEWHWHNVAFLQILLLLTSLGPLKCNVPRFHRRLTQLN